MFKFRNIEEILAEKGELVKRLTFNAKSTKQQIGGGGEEEANIEIILEENSQDILKLKE